MWIHTCIKFCNLKVPKFKGLHEAAAAEHCHCALPWEKCVCHVRKICSYLKCIISWSDISRFVKTLQNWPQLKCSPEISAQTCPWRQRSERPEIVDLLRMRTTHQYGDGLGETSSGYFAKNLRCYKAHRAAKSPFKGVSIWCSMWVNDWRRFVMVFRPQTPPIEPGKRGLCEGECPTPSLVVCFGWCCWQNLGKSGWKTECQPQYLCLGAC